MKNTFGNSLTLTLFGESHGEMIGAVLDGMTPGVKIDRAWIDYRLSCRRPAGQIATARRETDAYRIVSGVAGAYTTGTPLTLLIPNTDTHSADYQSLCETPRPGHADYTAQCKYHGFQDARGGGHFSGRITAALVAAGALVEAALRTHGIFIGTHIRLLGGVQDSALTDAGQLPDLERRTFPVLDAPAGEKMKERILAAAQEGDSVGGELETVIFGIPAGLGEPWFDTTEGMLAHAVFSVPGVKGCSFGAGFALGNMRGSEANDPFRMEGTQVRTVKNDAGGILGGITNGMPIVMHTVVKPTPSIFKPQETVNLKTGENNMLCLQGRHDPAIVHRAAPVISTVCALVIADLMIGHYGTDYLLKGNARQ